MIIPQWLEKYHLFLFDLDGLLVDTENIHYQAYKQCLQQYDVALEWDFTTYCLQAHQDTQNLQQKLLQKLSDHSPQTPPSWNSFYQQKKKIAQNLLQSEPIVFLPGVYDFLYDLLQKKKKIAIVTHSSSDHVSIIREKNPLLKEIKHWITKEDVTNPKPHPEGYQKAKDQLANNNDLVVGFEDTPRGITALTLASCQPIWITKIPYPEITAYQKNSGLFFPSFKKIF